MDTGRAVTRHGAVTIMPTDYTPQQLISVFVVLMCASFLYNGVYIDVLAQYLPARWRRTSIEVVIGVSMTLIGAGVLLGTRTMVLLFLLFAASGVPMIYGDFRRTDALAE